MKRKNQIRSGVKARSPTPDRRIRDSKLRPNIEEVDMCLSCTRKGCNGYCDKIKNKEYLNIGE